MKMKCVKVDTGVTHHHIRDFYVHDGTYDSRSKRMNCSIHRNGSALRPQKSVAKNPTRNIN